MDFPEFKPPLEFARLLNVAAPTSRDWVLYCTECEFIGECNAAYSSSFMRSHGGSLRCEGKLRIWRGEGE
jgi:hypothetical protein